jgi:hypothetical protein
MALFNFNDDKSRRQIDKANNNRLPGAFTQNIANLEAYRRKAGRLRDARGEWELAESIQT